jgi:porin
MKIVHSLSLAALITTFSFSAFADSSGHFNNTLTKDWNGYREKLYNDGINISSYYRVDSIYNNNGGKAQGDKFLDRFAITVDLDGSKMFDAKDLTAHITYYNNSGGVPDDFVGSLQGTNNMETRKNKNMSKFYEAFVQKNFMDNKVSILAGIRDINNEFFHVPASSLFIHQIDDVDNVYPHMASRTSIAPISTTLRAKITPNENYYIQAAVSDRNSGAYNYPGVSGFRHLALVEAGITPLCNCLKNRFAVGYWRYKDRFTKSNAEGLKKYQGFYVVAESQIYQEEGSLDQGLNGFIKAKFGSDNVVASNRTVNAGLVYKGLIQNRDNSTLGLAIMDTRIDRNYRRLHNLKSHETTYELTYSDTILPWLVIQPDLQYIVNPSAVSGLKNATVVGLRLQAKI